ncbi:chaperone modulator CbpM [Agarivorans sp. Z349TD_8]|uniref:chaperone modulator CbpM n=1 Tax=Agarivorans sp. Z349TD_8 TaxID=3421434 RepID=UPI003D7ED424
MSEAFVNISFNELCQLAGIERDVLINVVEYGIVQPLRGEGIERWIFDTTSLHWIKKAVRLHQDLEIDWVAVAMVVNLLQQNENLLKQNQAYQRQLQRFIGG